MIAVALHLRDAAAQLAGIRAAEQAGVRAAWITTGAGPDGLTVLAAAAATTRSVTLGTAIVPTFPRHPLVVAQQAADLHALSAGRFILGLGPSHASIMQDRYGIAYERPLTHLREFVGIVSALLRGEQVDHEGKQYRVHAKLFQAAPVPVYISALRAGSFALAGEIADGAISWLCPARYLRDVAAPALARKADGKRARLVGHAFVALNADASDVQDAMQDYLMHYPRLTNYQEMFAAAGFPEARQGVWSQAMLEAVVLHGDETVCERKVREFLQVSGCDELILSIMPCGQDKDRSIEQALRWIGSSAF